MKYWKGIWIMAVAGLHTAYAAVAFKTQIIEILKRGLFNSVDSMEMSAAVWFLLFGFLIFVVGLLIHDQEKICNKQVSKSVSGCLLAITILGIVLMPKSGFWFMFPPIMAMLVGKKQDPPIA